MTEPEVKEKRGRGRPRKPKDKTSPSQQLIDLIKANPELLATLSQLTQAKPAPAVEPKAEKKVNLFDSDPTRLEHREDTKVDKLLWAGRTPMSRRSEPNLVEATCSKCHKVEQVSPDLLSGMSNYRCNECVVS